MLSYFTIDIIEAVAIVLTKVKSGDFLGKNMMSFV